MLLRLLLILSLVQSAFAISELNDDFADKEFAHYFSSVYSTSIPQAKRSLDSFEQHLQIQPAQLESWQRFKLTFLHQLEQREARRNQLERFKQSNQSINSIETLSLRQQHLETRAHETRELLTVVNTLYQQLSQEQKRLFDNTMTHLWTGRSLMNRRRN